MQKLRDLAGMALIGSLALSIALTPYGVFAEDHVMHQWSREQSPRDKIESSRSRPMSRAKRGHEGKFHILPEHRIPGYQQCWATEYVLNVPQPDNLQERVEDGWLRSPD